MHFQYVSLIARSVTPSAQSKLIPRYTLTIKTAMCDNELQLLLISMLMCTMLEIVHTLCLEN